MTNFEYYKTLGNAINAYEKETDESVYNVHKGVSAGRFIDWLYLEHGSPIKPITVEHVKSDRACCNNTDRTDQAVKSPNIKDIINRLNGLVDSKGETTQSYQSEVEKIAKSLTELDCVPNINYQSIFDEADEMAYILRKIDQETKDCARCKGECSGSYSTDEYLKSICEILYSSCGYHFDRKYTNGQT